MVSIGSPESIAPKLDESSLPRGEGANNPKCSSIRPMFTCNIDQRGKTMRFILGAFVE